MKEKNTVVILVSLFFLGVKEFQRLASTLVEKAVETNFHLQELLKEMKEQNRLVSARVGIAEPGLKTSTEAMPLNYCTPQSPGLSWVTKLSTVDPESFKVNKSFKTECFGGADYYNDKDGLGQFIPDPYHTPEPALQPNTHSSPDLRLRSPRRRDLYSSESGEDDQRPSRSEGEQTPRLPQVTEPRPPARRQERSQSHQESDLPPRNDVPEGQRSSDGETPARSQSSSKETAAQEKARKPPEKETLEPNKPSQSQPHKDQ